MFVWRAILRHCARLPEQAKVVYSGTLFQSFLTASSTPPPFRVEEEGARVDKAARVDDVFYFGTLVYSGTEVGSRCRSTGKEALLYAPLPCVIKFLLILQFGMQIFLCLQCVECELSHHSIYLSVYLELYLWLSFYLKCMCMPASAFCYINFTSVVQITSNLRRRSDKWTSYFFNIRLYVT